MSIQSESMKRYFALQGIKNKDIMEALGISAAAVSNLLSGHDKVGRLRAQQLHAAYGFNIEFLLKGQGDLLPASSTVQHLEVSHNSGNSKNTITVQSNDVTALQAQNQALRSENAWLRSMVESLSKKSGD